MAKKKRTEVSEAGSTPTDPLAADEEFVGPPAPEPMLAPSPGPPRAELIVVQPTNADTLPAPPVAQPAADSLGPLQERLHKLEAALAGLQQLQGMEQRVVEQVTTQLQREKPAAPPAPAGPSVLARAATLLEAGKHLLPGLPAGPAQAKSRGWLIGEMVAELRAMVCMYTDPRYHMSRWGYLLPPALFLAFLLARFWLHIVPFYALLEKAYLGWLIALPVELGLLYAMFKILGHEARRYRETAPDLPPSLRL